MEIMDGRRRGRILRSSIRVLRSGIPENMTETIVENPSYNNIDFFKNSTVEGDMRRLKRLKRK